MLLLWKLAMNSRFVISWSTYVPIVQQLVPAWLALMASDEEAQLVLLQEVGRHVWTEVCSRAPQSVGHAPARALRVRPQDVKYL